MAVWCNVTIWYFSSDSVLRKSHHLQRFSHISRQKECLWRKQSSISVTRTVCFFKPYNLSSASEIEHRIQLCILWWIIFNVMELMLTTFHQTWINLYFWIHTLFFLHLFSLLGECLDDRAVCKGNFALLALNLFRQTILHSSGYHFGIIHKHCVNLKEKIKFKKKK